MHQLLLWILVSGGVLLVLALALVPLVLAWPRYVRWVVVAHSVGDVATPFAPALDLREVVVLSVAASGGTLGLEVLETGHPPAHAVLLVGERPPAPALVSMLEEWRVLRTPMLLYVDPAGAATLTGPVAVVTHLRRRSQADPVESGPGRYDAAW